MRKNILISLVSDQTLPNLELIKEFSGFINEYLFIHSEQTRQQLGWIIKAANISEYKSIMVNAFDISDIETKLKEYDFQDDEYYLNITGGTKLMILIFQEYFKNLGARIYYLTGQNREYIKVFPVIGERKFQLKSRITLNEYLTVYGFEIKDSIPIKDFEQAQKILSYFLKNNIRNNLTEIEQIRNRRGKQLLFSDYPEVAGFMNELGFAPTENNKLNKKETKYLSGDWFEEYVYYKIKDELNLMDDEIGTGYNLTKQNTPNEIDVIFIYRHRLYIIECKTSVTESRLMPDGSIKGFKFLPEVIYKSDALKNKFGLQANTSIMTLEEIKNEDGTPAEGYKTHFDRAELSRINILSKQDFESGRSIKSLLKID